MSENTHTRERKTGIWEDGNTTLYEDRTEEACPMSSLEQLLLTCSIQPEQDSWQDFSLVLLHSLFETCEQLTSGDKSKL